MADELQLTVTLRHTKLPKVNFASGSITFDQTGYGVASVIQEIGTSEEDVDLAQLDTEGICILYNLDATNYVTWGKKDGSNNMQAIGKLGPTVGTGSCPIAVFGFNAGATLRMLANTAACKVQIICYEI